MTINKDALKLAVAFVPESDDAQYYREMRELATKMAELITSNTAEDMAILAVLDVGVRLYRKHGCCERQALISLRRDIDDLIDASDRLPERH